MNDDLISRDAVLDACSQFYGILDAMGRIEELPSVNPKPCEDAISRQAVDEAIYDYSRSCDVNYAQIMEYIDKIPSVTPKQRTGHWIKRPHGFQCSKCLIVHSGTSMFCPSCGAKMVEPWESEEQA